MRGFESAILRWVAVFVGVVLVFALLFYVQGAEGKELALGSEPALLNGKSGVIFAVDDKAKKAFMSCDFYLNNRNSLDVFSMDESGIRLSKYDFIALPYVEKTIEDKLLKFFDAGIGIYFYSEPVYMSKGNEAGEALDSSSFARIAGKGELKARINIGGTGENVISKAAHARVIREGKVKGFDAVGWYSEPDASVYVSIDKKPDNPYEDLLMALWGSHAEMRAGETGKKAPPIRVIAYGAGINEKLSVEHDLYRNYDFDSPKEYDFVFYSAIAAKRGGDFVTGLKLSVDTNEPACVLEAAPKSLFMLPFGTLSKPIFERSTFERDSMDYSVPIDLKATVDTARSEARYSVLSSLLFPKTLSSYRQKTAIRMRTKKETLTLDVSALCVSAGGSFEQYSNGYGEDLNYSIYVDF